MVLGRKGGGTGNRIALAVAVSALAAAGILISVCAVVIGVADGGGGEVTDSGVQITAPSPESVEGSSTPTFRGTGASGASVTVSDFGGYVLCAARVERGSWSCESSRPMGDGHTMVFAEQNLQGATRRDQVAFVVDTASQHSAIPPTDLLAGGVVIILGLAAVSSCALYLRRRARGEQTRTTGNPRTTD